MLQFLLIPRRGWTFLLFGVLFVDFIAADDPAMPNNGVTFSHVYKIDLPKTSDCKVEMDSLPVQDQMGEQMSPLENVDGDNNIVFRHNIRLQTPKCDCESSESFKELLYRVNGLEEEVTYLKTQCTQGCCGGGGGLNDMCSGHGTFKQESCGCICDEGWEGEDCSKRACPNNCNDNGHCVDGQCVCYEGFAGVDCSELLCPNECNDKGRCVDGVCQCFSHYMGEDCSQRRCPNDCSGNGECDDGVCVCQEGFNGNDCSKVMGPKSIRLLKSSEESLLVEWDHVPGAEYYVLTYYPEGEKGSIQQIKVPNNKNSYLITGLTPGVKYIVDVYAVIKEIFSEPESLEATTELSGIQGIRVVTQTEGSLQVEWQNPAYEVDYFRLTYVNPEGQEEEVTVPQSFEAKTSYTITGLLPGTKYLTKVIAIKGNSEGNPSSVYGETDIDAPTNLVTQTVTEDTATVSWDRVQAPIDGYMLSYSSADGQRKEIHVGADRSSYQLTGLRPGVEYTVYIWAVKGKRVSKKTSAEAVTDIDAPTNLVTRTVTEDTATMSWNRVQAPIDGYMLSYRSADGQSQDIPVGADRSSYQLTGLKPGVEYTVYIWAVKGKRVSKKTTAETVTDIDAPTNLATRTVTEDTATMSWNRVQAPIDGYMLSYRSADGQSQDIPVGADRSSYQLTGLKPGVEYTVYIWAVKGKRVSKKTSTEAVTDIDAPTNLATRTVTEDTATMSWNRVQAPIDGYMLSYRSADGQSQDIPVGADRSSYQLTGLKPGVEYTVYIWAVKGKRVSKKTSTEAVTVIDPPSNLKASNVQLSGGVLSWRPPQAAIDGYILTYQREDGSGQVIEKQVGSGETRFTLDGLDMGKKYIVNLLAFRGTQRSKVIKTTFSTVGVRFPFPMDCSQIMQNGIQSNGVYTIYLNSDVSKPMQVYCDMTTDGGGWIVFQRRNSGKVDFFKRWKQYLQGFGNLTEEFWLGLEKIYELTNTNTQYELRVDLRAGSESVYAVYDNFKLAPVKQKFKLTVGNYRGNAGDAMTYHQGRPFSTMDQDHDIALSNCALTHRGAWWYKNCHLANLNGRYGDSKHSVGVNWEPWKGHEFSIEFAEMKIRPHVASDTIVLGRKKRSVAGRKSRTL